MGSEWTIGALGDVAKVQSGYAFKSGDMGESGHPVIKIKNIHPPDVDISDVQRVPPSIIEGNTRIEKFRLSKGDILIAMTGATVGKVGRMPKLSEPHYLNQRVGKVFVTDDAKADEDYVYYVLSQDGHVDQMLDLADGSAQPNISGTQIESLEVPLPPHPEQKAIAHILGSLDDKIELNRRMNATLEGMAQALFKSWFVDFDPVIDNALAAGNPIPDELAVRAEVRRQALANGTANREAAKPFPAAFQETETMGWIPEGWEVKSIADVTHAVTKGDTPRQDAISAAPEGDKMVNLLRVNSITENGEVLMDKLQQIPETIHNGKSKRSILREGYILYTNAGTIGRVSCVQKEILPANTNQAIAIIQPDISLIPSKFLYMVMRHSEFQESLHHDITQAVQANLALGKISNALFTVPDKNTLLFAHRILEGLLDRIWANRRTSDSLTKLRDTLLPKLISGELRVEESKAQIEVKAHEH